MSDTFDCPYCDVKAKSRQGFEKHAKATHPGEAFFFCPDCTTVAKSESGMKRHQQSSKHGAYK